MRFSCTTKAWLEKILSSDEQKPQEATPPSQLDASKKPNDLQRQQQKKTKKNPSSSSSSSSFYSSPKTVLVSSMPNFSASSRSLKRGRPSDDSKRVEIVGEETKRTKRGKMMANKEEDACGFLAPLKKVDGDGIILSSTCVSCATSSSSPVLPPPLGVHEGMNGAPAVPEINDLSADKAAHLVMIKSRFARSILKVQGLETSDAMIEKFRARQQAELGRANEWISEQRQRDREAARLALSEMEKKVVIEDNFKTLKEFQMLISCQGHLC